MMDSWISVAGLFQRVKRSTSGAERSGVPRPGVRDDEDCQFEGFHYVGPEAWKNRSGHSGLEAPDHGLAHPMEPAGERWSEDGDDLKQRFPKLWKKFSPPPPRAIRIVAAPQGERRRHSAQPGSGVYSRCLRERIALSQALKHMESFPGAGGPSTRYKVPALDAILVLEQHDVRCSPVVEGRKMCRTCYSPESYSRSLRLCASYCLCRSHERTVHKCIATADLTRAGQPALRDIGRRMCKCVAGGSDRTITCRTSPSRVRDGIR